MSVTALNRNVNVSQIAIGVEPHHLWQVVIFHRQRVLYLLWMHLVSVDRPDKVLRMQAVKGGLVAILV